MKNFCTDIDRLWLIFVCYAVSDVVPFHDKVNPVVYNMLHESSNASYPGYEISRESTKFTLMLWTLYFSKGQASNLPNREDLGQEVSILIP
uniref:Uncharacterized protein n=1 Tax=Lactuca sativa TaxID=4236 RepID=A0A9R1V629_LACSA|nr:hypothetical protein LSAT_V11C600314910 [Lactuca sativa]